MGHLFHKGIYPVFTICTYVICTIMRYNFCSNVNIECLYVSDFGVMYCVVIVSVNKLPNNFLYQGVGTCLPIII